MDVAWIEVGGCAAAAPRDVVISRFSPAERTRFHAGELVHTPMYIAPYVYKQPFNERRHEVEMTIMALIEVPVDATITVMVEHSTMNKETHQGQDAAATAAPPRQSHEKTR